MFLSPTNSAFWKFALCLRQQHLAVRAMTQMERAPSATARIAMASDTGASVLSCAASARSLGFMNPEIVLFRHQSGSEEL